MEISTRKQRRGEGLHDFIQVILFDGQGVSRRSGDELIDEIDLPIEMDMGRIYVRVVGLSSWISRHAS